MSLNQVIYKVLRCRKDFFPYSIRDFLIVSILVVKAWCQGVGTFSQRAKGLESHVPTAREDVLTAATGLLGVRII